MHPSPFAEDDKQWPGEDVTSTSQHQNFDEKFDQEPESVRIKMADLAGRLNQKGSKKRQTNTTQPRKRRKDTDTMWKNKKNARICVISALPQEDEENREFKRSMPEMPILIDSDVISINIQIYDDVGSARSL